MCLIIWKRVFLQSKSSTWIAGIAWLLTFPLYSMNSTELSILLTKVSIRYISHISLYIWTPRSCTSVDTCFRRISRALSRRRIEISGTTFDSSIYVPSPPSGISLLRQIRFSKSALASRTCETQTRFVRFLRIHYTWLVKKSERERGWERRGEREWQMIPRNVIKSIIMKHDDAYWR